MKVETYEVKELILNKKEAIKLKNILDFSIQNSIFEYHRMEAKEFREIVQNYVIFLKPEKPFRLVLDHANLSVFINILKEFEDEFSKKICEALK